MTMQPSWLESLMAGMQSTFGYFLFGSILFIPVSAIIVLPLWIAGSLLRRPALRRFALNTFTFLFLVFLFGAIPNLLFGVLLQNRWYYTADPLIDFLPFFPSIELTVDSVCGGRLINGTTPMQFYSAWLFAAVATWSLAAITYRRLSA